MGEQVVSPRLQPAGEVVQCGLGDAVPAGVSVTLRCSAGLGVQIGPGALEKFGRDHPGVVALGDEHRDLGQA